MHARAGGHGGGRRVAAAGFAGTVARGVGAWGALAARGGRRTYNLANLCSDRRTAPHRKCAIFGAESPTRKSSRPVRRPRSRRLRSYNRPLKNCALRGHERWRVEHVTTLRRPGVYRASSPPPDEPFGSSSTSPVSDAVRVDEGPPVAFQEMTAAIPLTERMPLGGAVWEPPHAIQADPAPLLSHKPTSPSGCRLPWRDLQPRRTIGKGGEGGQK
jgi:hypothetical protein